MQQHRVVQTQRIKAIRQLHDQYNKSLADLEKVHQNQQTNIQGEIRKDLSQLQKKMLKDTVSTQKENSKYQNL